ncbi:MAG: TonB family protein [Alphaproteobacteria bacterium]
MTTLAHQRPALSEPAPHGWASGGLLSAAIHIGIVVVVANLLWSHAGDHDAPQPGLVIEIVSAAQAADTLAVRPTAASPAEPEAEQSEPTPSQTAPAEPTPATPVRDPALSRTADPLPQKLAEPTLPPPQPATLAPPQPKPKPVAKPHQVRQAQTKPAPVDALPDANRIDPIGSNAAANVQQASLPPGDGDIPVVTNPRFRAPPTPASYPRRSVELSEEGTVMIRALVDASGFARDVRIWRSSGHSKLDEAARAAVAQWQFEPARQAGRPITAWVEIPVNFRLQ